MTVLLLVMGVVFRVAPWRGKHTRWRRGAVVRTNRSISAWPHAFPAALATVRIEISVLTEAISSCCRHAGHHAVTSSSSSSSNRNSTRTLGHGAAKESPAQLPPPRREAVAAALLTRF
jgi:hypothetical protein